MVGKPHDTTSDDYCERQGGKARPGEWCRGGENAFLPPAATAVACARGRAELCAQKSAQNRASSEREISAQAIERGESWRHRRTERTEAAHSGRALPLSLPLCACLRRGPRPLCRGTAARSSEGGGQRGSSSRAMHYCYYRLVGPAPPPPSLGPNKFAAGSGHTRACVCVRAHKKRSRGNSLAVPRGAARLSWSARSAADGRGGGNMPD